jgi:secondary thiamine-phosphate synthase enzyme
MRLIITPLHIMVKPPWPHGPKGYAWTGVPDSPGSPKEKALGSMRVTEFEVDTRGRRVLDITSRVRAFVAEGNESGLAHVFLPHATAGLALIETGSGSEADLDELLERLLPREYRYAHRHGARGHGGDHLLPALVSPSLVLPVDRGELVLGTWQSVVIVDPNRDNDRRRVRVAVLAG